MACGTMALAALEALTAGVKVRCQIVERDRHGRVVAKVFSPNGVDIGRRLVLAGWALAYRRYSTDYIAAEHEARDLQSIAMSRAGLSQPEESQVDQRSPPRMPHVLSLAIACDA